ncbi:phytase [Salicola sp. Rm-C-2C1-2]|uniref:phytase n=1 Tax=Salicola sp. Rm-C-2C1-2 TaxID=3141321 RepID=UPI0032E3F79A
MATRSLQNLCSSLALVLTVTVAAGCTHSATDAHSSTNESGDKKLKLGEPGRLDLPGEWAAAVSGGEQPLWLSVGENSGARLHDGRGRAIAYWDRPLEYLDALPPSDDGRGVFAARTIYASYNSNNGRPVLFGIGTDGDGVAFQPMLEGDATEYAVEDVCLYRAGGGALYLFMMGEDYRAHQMMVTGDDGDYRLRPVRALPAPPGGEYCTVDQTSGTLYLSEEDRGIYAYEAQPETSVQRTIVEVAAPWGHLGGGPRDLAIGAGDLYTLERQRSALHGIGTDNGSSRYDGRHELGKNAAPETVTVSRANGERHLMVFDEGAERFTHFPLPASAKSEPTQRMPEVRASLQTDSVASPGDAADDPAIWVHPEEPAQSLILGTDKQAGLYVYDLAGRERQFIGNGRINNVDVRYGASFNGSRVDVAAATNRTSRTISLYAIDRDAAQLSLVTEVSTQLDEIYGFCLYQPDDGPLYGFANSKDGTVDQFKLSVSGAEWSGERVRRFSVPSQPEGCVADDERERLFVGEEARGIHAIGANPDDGTQTRRVAPIDNEILFADVEGLNIYRGVKRDYLVASAQNNNSYALYDAAPPFEPLAAFRIGMNPEAGIDGASETDGVFATNADLGPGFPEGMLVVQDGRNVMPEANQNFKAVPWERIRQTLDLD